jgi:TetR/AcrR family transcriptional regulator, ethionamide resistance regulator
MPSVTRHARSTRDDRRAELRRRLLDVVEALLEKGESFAELSVERLVTEADISRSTFYVYFQDKGDLLRAWFAEINTELAAAAAGWWQLGSGLTREDLHAVLDRIVRAYQPHITVMAALYDTAAYDPLVRELVNEMMASNIAGLRKHIRTGQREGFVDATLLSEQTAAWLTWMAERGLHQLVRGASPAELDRLIEAYTDIVWNVLYASP